MGDRLNASGNVVDEDVEGIVGEFGARNPLGARVRGTGVETPSAFAIFARRSGVKGARGAGHAACELVVDVGERWFDSPVSLGDESGMVVVGRR